MTSVTQNHRPRLAPEPLEDRLALTCMIPNGDLWIIGTGGNDTVEVYQRNWWGGPFIEVIENGRSTFFKASDIWRESVFGDGKIEFYGFGGNDYINNNVGSLRLNAWGGEGDDVLIGDASNDILQGEGGNDKLFGYGGNDDLRGGWGLDYVYGGDGNDWMDGGAGDGFIDYLEGGRGVDGYCLSWWGERDRCVGYTLNVERDWTYWV
ncbi:MAG: hypothetical protein U0797_25765 [Gemmataceae bacterium]